MSVLTPAHSSRGEPMRVLEEIKRQAVEQLGGVPDALYPGIEQSLSAALQAGDVGPDHFEDLTSLRMLRQQAASLVMRYRQQLAKGFDDLRGLRMRTRGDLPLGLVEENHLEFHLEGQRLVESLEGRFAEPLQVMRQRLLMMTEMLGLPDAPNPIAPERLVAALVESFRETEPTRHVRELLFRYYEGELVRRLGDLYGRVNALLSATGYGHHGMAAPGHAPAQHAPVQHGYRHDTVEAVPYRGAAMGMEAMQGFMEQMGVGMSTGGSPGMSLPGQDMADLRAILRMWREGGLGTPQPRAAAADAAPGMTTAPGANCAWTRCSVWSVCCSPSRRTPLPVRWPVRGGWVRRSATT
ncbi:DUF1631 family protein [Marilutibacter alkalisoli]|nr:DUF1631 family protein [Lysobacter alkalisoli]